MNKLTLAIAALAVAILIKWQCEPTVYTPPTIQKRDSIITQINTKLKHDSVYVDRWHKAIHTTDSVVKLVYFSAPDTCKPYLDTIAKEIENERARVLDVISSKDSIIVSFKALSKLDSISISNLQTDTATLRKQVKKRGKVAFGLGYVLGLGTGVIINKLK